MYFYSINYKPILSFWGADEKVLIVTDMDESKITDYFNRKGRRILYINKLDKTGAMFERNGRNRKIDIIMDGYY